jgi:hypothetical protein
MLSTHLWHYQSDLACRPADAKKFPTWSDESGAQWEPRRTLTRPLRHPQNRSAYETPEPIAGILRRGVS